jgi:ABC-type glycerol-3-phosphate transport system substrate-binding protein
MPRIRLAHWHDGHAPGDVITVDDEALRALARDGRVNELLPDEPEPAPEPLPEAAPEPVAEEPPKRRKASP